MTVSSVGYAFVSRAGLANEETPVASDRVERRLAAILAADMVGYSRLMEADEAGTIHRDEPIAAC